MRTGTAVLAGLAIATSSLSGARTAGPLPLLRGATLRGPTHLRLIVADAPPFVLDVDRHTVRRIGGVASPGRDVVDLMRAPGGAVAIVDRLCSRCGARTRAFMVTAAGPARRIVMGSRVVAARKAAARWAVKRGPGEGLTLVDRARGRRRRLRWPSVLAELDGAIAEPHGPFVAIGFADPAYGGGPPQAEDLFLLDTRTDALTHVPGFPVALDLKFSNMAWTSDDRLVLLFQAEGVTSIGVYRPGNRAVAVRRVQIPPRGGGSDQFVPIVSG
jgi:hypothetical protein